ncbi:hypothetical protein MAM1_0005d00642 [Mucor ambiguus]|uniref:Chromatin assembly factor 1 subunit A dimerization domain-containing protein n=1 Tax=Mucor ambiguus TaxID=91626 RepID=A0A0C9LQ39_9FUNG|nr:hypothetical protein MAM1_0005d00642 [Mucor ambiguus]
MEAAVNDLSIAKQHPQKAVDGHRFIENGQVIYQEERLRIENHKVFSKAIIHFREWRANAESTSTTIRALDIPQEYTYLIAMLAHESDESLNSLAKRLNDLLSPFDKSNEASFSFYKAIKQIIKLAAHQERYGLADVVLLMKGAPATVPKRLSMFRWQVRDTSKLPADVMKAATRKRDKRKLFSSMFTKAFLSLSESERIELLHDENGSFIIESSAEEAMADTLLSPFKQRDYVALAPLARQPRKRLCSSFDTLLYVGLNDTFDLRQRFLEELPRKAKAKRGVTPQMMDLQKAWLGSTRTGATTTIQLPGLKMKLLQFHEDVRPAFYGIWTKDKSVVTGRTPFAKHEALDYEYDSEAEWDHDVDGDDIYTLDPDEDEDMLFPDDEEEMASFSVTNGEEDENKWVVPEGYLSDDEGIHVVGFSQKHKHGIVSRPAKWPIAGNKLVLAQHFPMKPLILGPSFEATNEPENHPLSDFKMHLLIHADNHEGYSPFTLFDDDNKETPNAPSNICFEPDKSKSPLYRREIDKMQQENRQELIDVIVNNTSKTMMGLVNLLKAKTGFEEYTVAQLQAMIHDLAIQEVRGSSKVNTIGIFGRKGR